MKTLNFVKTLALAAVSFGLALVAQAADLVPIKYIAADGSTLSTDEYTVIQGDTAALNGGLYFVEEDVTHNGTVTVSGDTILIIKEGVKFTVTGSAGYNGWDCDIDGGKGGLGLKLAEADAKLTITTDSWDNPGMLSVTGGAGGKGCGDEFLSSEGGVGGSAVGLAAASVPGDFTVWAGKVILQGAVGGLDGSGRYREESGYAFDGGMTSLEGVAITMSKRESAKADGTAVPSAENMRSSFAGKRSAAFEPLPAPPVPIAFSVTAPTHSTAAIYTNSVAAANLVPDAGNVWSNKTAYVVYTADRDKDWYFKGDVWTKAITNQLDTSVNPAVDTNTIPSIIEATCTRTELKAGELAELDAGTTITAAPAELDGGAFYVGMNATLTGTNVVFKDNSSGVSGGAIYCKGTVSLANATFEGNTASTGGGAIRNNAILNLEDVVFDGNVAQMVGGAIGNNGTMTFRGFVTLKTPTDTIYNDGGATVVWDLTGEKTACLNGYQNLGNSGGELKIVVDDTLVAPKDIVIATGDFGDVVGKDFFKIANVTSGAWAIIDIDGEIVTLGSDYWQLVTEAAGETTNLVLKALKSAKLTDVAIAGTTAVVKMGETEITPVEGVYSVLAGEPLTVTYTADADYMFEAGLTTKTVMLAGFAGDYAMTAEDKASVTAALTVAWADEREVAVDTRERIVIGDPNEVLPIALSTNFWGAAEGGTIEEVGVFDSEGNLEASEGTSHGNFYLDWQPTEGEYGAYAVMAYVSDENYYLIQAVTNYIYYSAPHTLTIAASEGGTIAVTDAGAAVASGASVLGYTLLNLTATPVPLTNDARYEFAGWTATTNGVDCGGALGDRALPETTLEMPNADTVLAANFKWKSIFAETVTVEADYTWEVLADDDYQDGLYNEGTVVWKPGQTNAQGRAYGLEDFGQLHNGLGGKLQIVFDETLTNATYKLGIGYTAVGMTFEITDGVNAGNCTAVWEDDYATAGWTYVGAKRFKLWVEGDHSDLLLEVEDGTPHTLTIAAPENGTIAAATNGVTVTSGEKVFPAMKVSLTATPVPLTNDARYEFAGWTATTNGVDCGGALGDRALPETTLEMPNADTVIAANFQWKSNYTENVEVAAGETWQVFPGETYSVADWRAMYVGDGHVFGEGATFAGSTLPDDWYGAGCYLEDGSIFAFTNVVFKDNVAAGYTGADVFCSTGAFVRCSFVNNYARFYNEDCGAAGGLGVDQGEVVLEDCIFDGNRSDFGADGALQNWYGTIYLRGTNVFKTSTDAIWNSGLMVWDFTNGGTPCIDTAAGFTNDVEEDEEGTFEVVYDATLTNGTYTLIHLQGDDWYFNGSDDVTVSGPDGEAVCTLDGDRVYLGAKRFKTQLTEDAFQLVVEDGKFAITYDAMGGAWSDGSETNVVDSYVKDGYVFPEAEPTRENNTFMGWFASWTNHAAQVFAGETLVTNGVHTLYAKWTPVATEVTEKDIAIADITNGVPVMTIGDYDYAQATHKTQAFESLVTPVYLTSIGQGAFQGVATLKKLVITQPRSYDNPSIYTTLTIGQQAFASCTALEELRIPDGIALIGNSAFQNCAKLKRILFTGTNTVVYGSKAFYRCGWTNGTDELKVYMSKAFSDNNASLTNALASWNTQLKVVPLVGVSPIAGEAKIAATDFGSLGADRKAAVLVKVPTAVPGTKPDVSSVTLLHSTNLSDWTAVTPDSSTANEDGTVFVEFKMPEGTSGFIKVEVK